MNKRFLKKTDHVGRINKKVKLQKERETPTGITKTKRRPYDDSSSLSKNKVLKTYHPIATFYFQYR